MCWSVCLAVCLLYIYIYIYISTIVYQTINRTGRKLHHPSSFSPSGGHRDGRGTERHADCTSDVDDSHTSGTRNSDLLDFGGTDIYNDNGWDTDLEAEGRE